MSKSTITQNCNMEHEEVAQYLKDVANRLEIVSNFIVERSFTRSDDFALICFEEVSEYAKEAFLVAAKSLEKIS